MNINKEDMVQSALNVQRYCKKHIEQEKVCDCPFGYIDSFGFHSCALYVAQYPMEMELEEFLRTRGIKDGK